MQLKLIIPDQFYVASLILWAVRWRFETLPCSTSPDALTEGQTLLLPSGRLSARDKEILEGIGPWTYRTYPVRAGETLNVSCCSQSLRPLCMGLAHAAVGSACRPAARHGDVPNTARGSTQVSHLLDL
jgi:hypothetical protein